MSTRSAKQPIVKYVKSFTVEDGITHLRFDSKRIELSATKRYHNVLLLLFALPECARNLMDYLMDNMTEENIVHSNQFTRDAFNRHVYKAWLEHYKTEIAVAEAELLAEKKMYSDVTIRKAFGALKDKGLIFSETRGVFLVNPEYFFKKSEQSRVNKIKMYLEFENGINSTKISAEAQ